MREDTPEGWLAGPAGLEMGRKRWGVAAK